MLQVEWIPATFLCDKVDYVPRIERLKVDLHRLLKLLTDEKKNEKKEKKMTGIPQQPRRLQAPAHSNLACVRYQPIAWGSTILQYYDRTMLLYIVFIEHSPTETRRTAVTQVATDDNHHNTAQLASRHQRVSITGQQTIFKKLSHPPLYTAY